MRLSSSCPQLMSLAPYFTPFPAASDETHITHLDYMPGPGGHLDFHPCLIVYLMLSIQQGGLHTLVVFPTQVSVVLTILDPHEKQKVIH